MQFIYFSPTLPGQAAIKARYRALSKALHPDNEGGDKESFQKMQYEFDILEDNNFVFPPEDEITTERTMPDLNVSIAGRSYNLGKAEDQHNILKDAGIGLLKKILGR